MLASVFVVNGIKALKDPESLVSVAEPIAEKVVPLAKKYAPDQVSGTIPDDTVTLVRIGGALQVVGGLGLATGKARRGSALMLALSLVPKTIASNPMQKGLSAEEKKEQRSDLLTNVALMGGVLVASQDTEGKPSLAWRAHKGGEMIADKASKASASISKETKKAAKDARKQAKKAKKAITS